MTEPLHHEESDVNIRAVFGFGAGLLAVSVVVYFVVWLIFIYFNGRETATNALQYPLATGQEERLPPEPRLQVTPREDLRQMRAAEDELLHSYRWVDRDAGVVRIPIDEAMRLTVERGLPARRQGIGR